MIKFVVFVFSLIFISGCSSTSWRDASRESVGIAPKAEDLKEDIYQIYYARAFSWRGTFGIHPWVAWKKVDEPEYTVAQVTAWNIRREGTSLRVEQDLPDRKWFNNPPFLMYELRGDNASLAIEETIRLLQDYPFNKTYRVWPGPNSNTFIAYLTRNIDVLDIELPSHAIGKDYLGKNRLFTKTASNTGFVFSAYGVLGLSLGLEEGVELNLLGAHLGLDLTYPSLKLPFVGRVGFSDKSNHSKL